MYVQMFTGGVTDTATVRAVLESWPATAGRDAVGWLGSTAGITDDGQLVALARFTSEGAARVNSQRPEQGRWWQTLATNLDGAASFFESIDVDADLVGDPDTAGFVQVMRGRVSDPARARELSRFDPGVWAGYRPDILGSMLIGRDDGEYARAVYFTSEADAREGELKEPPAELSAQLAQMNALEVGEVTYYDLRDPWLASPSRLGRQM